MRHWRLAISVLVVLLIPAQAGAAPIFYAEEPPDALAAAPAELKSLGSSIEVWNEFLVIGGEMGASGVSATVVDPGSFDPVGTVFATKSIASGGSRLASVTSEPDDAAGDILKVHELVAGELTEVASTALATSRPFNRLGTQLAVGDRFVAVVDGGQGEEPDEIRIFDISPDPEPKLSEARTIQAGLSNTQIEIVGTSLIVSGVPPLGNVGHLVLFNLADGNEIDRLDNVGGGPLVIAGESIYVQRNQFFVQPSGTWTMVEFSDGVLGNATVIPGTGSTLSASNGLILVGDPIRNQVLVLESTPEDTWPFRFTQAIRNPRLRSADQFGAAVALVNGQALVGAPTVSDGDLVLRGAIYSYEPTDGPIGCTIVGSPGNDEKLTGTQGRDTMCGLDGDDRILGFAGDDVIYGGPGDDALLGNGGNDILYGDDGNDILNGGDDDDLLIGGVGDDTGNGGAGDDNFIGGAGRDKGNGGEGSNTCEAEQRFLC